MIPPLKGSTPPQKLSPTSANSRAPWAAPGTRLRPVREVGLGMPGTSVVDLWHGQVARRNLGADPFGEQLLVATVAYLLVDEQVEVIEQSVLVALGTQGDIVDGVGRVAGDLQVFVFTRLDRCGGDGIGDHRGVDMTLGHRQQRVVL